MEITIRKVDSTLILMHRNDNTETYSALAVNDLIERVDDLYRVTDDDIRLTSTLNLVNTLLKSLQENEMLMDGTTFVE